MKRKIILFVAIILAVYSKIEVFGHDPVYHPFITAGFDHSFIALSSTNNTESVWGRKIGLDYHFVGTFHQTDDYIYSVDKDTVPGIGNCIMMKKGDLNGDGMDDIIGIYQFSTFTKVYAFDGNTGKLMFEFYDTSYGVPVYYLLEIGDYNGDGKDDIAVGRHASNSLKGTYVQFVDGEGVQFRSYSAQYINPGTIGSEDPVYLMKSVDVNRDGADDIVFIHHTQEYGNIVRAFNVKNNTFLYDYEIGISANRVNNLESGDFNDDGNKDEIVVSISKSKNYTLPLDNIYMIRYNDNEPNNVVVSVNTFNRSIKSIKIADLNQEFDNKDDLVLLTEYNWQNGIFNSSSVTTFDFASQSKISTFQDVVNNNRGYNIYLIETGDFNGDGIVNDVVYVRHAGNDNFNLPDPYQDGSYLVMLDKYGTLQFGYSSGPVYVNTPDSSTSVQGYEGINYISKLDYDADGTDELAIIHHLGTSNSITGSIIRVWDPLEHKLKMDVNNPGNILKSAVILDNEITDQEFLRALEIKYNSFTEFYNAFIDKPNYSLFQINYPDRRIIDAYKDTVISSIQTYSTFSKYDKYYDYEKVKFVGQTNTVFNMWGARIERLENTLNFYTQDSTKYPDETEFKYLIKSLLSHTRLLTVVDNLHLENYDTAPSSSPYYPDYDRYYWNLPMDVNHTVLFVARPMSHALRYLKDIKSTEMKKTEIPLDNHIRASMNYLYNADGTYAENSYSYSFWYNLNVAHYGSFKKMYLSQFISNLDITTIVGEIKNNLAKAYSYYLWAIKPNVRNLDPTGVNFKTDLPSYGDGATSQYIGKKSGNLLNIVEWPLCISHPTNPTFLLEPMIDKTLLLYKQLNFASNSDGDKEVPDSLFQAFKNGGYYITRSNWANPDNSYDTNARHCEFRLSPFRVGLNPGHHHLDMLSVTMTGYNKEFFVDPQGYENKIDIDSSELVLLIINTYGESFPLADYPIDKRKTAYFDGTAVHNTVYIGNNNQLPGFDQYVSNRENINYDSLYNEFSDDWNYASGGYTKTYGSMESHKRQLLYVNTLESKDASEDNKSDYWVVIDNIRWGNTTESTPAVQTWNLAPWCNPTINTADKSIRTSNFWMIPLNLNNGMTADVIDAKYAPLTDVLFPNKIVRYKVTGNNTTSCNFATIILPFGDDVAPESATITKIPVYTRFMGQLQHKDDRVIAFKFKFRKNGINYEDYICIIKDELNSSVKYYCDINGDGIREEITTKVTFNRGAAGIRKNSPTNIDNENSINPPISIYPNPAKNELMVNSINENSTISIYDINGTLVITQKATSNSLIIDLSNLKSGLYILKATDDVSQKVLKFVKQ